METVESSDQNNENIEVLGKEIDLDDYDEQKEQEFSDQKEIFEQKFNEEAIEEKEMQQQNVDLTTNKYQLSPDFETFKKYFLADYTDPSSGWRKLMQDQHQSIFIKKEEFSPIVIIRHESILKKYEYDIHEIFQIASDPQIRKMWDEVMIEYEIKETFDQFSDVFYQRIHAGPLVTDRDFIQYRYAFNNKQNPELIKKYGLEELDSEQSAYFVITRSVEREDTPIVKKLVRGQSHFGGFIVREDKENPKQIHQVMIQHLDIKGRIPCALFNYIAPRAFKKLSSAFEGAYPKVIKKLRELNNNKNNFKN